MKNKKLLIVWSISLIVVAVITIVLLITKVMGASIPDTVIRILSIVVAIAGPVMLVVAARTYNAEKKEKTEE